MVGNFNADETSLFKSKLNVQPQGLVLKDGIVVVEVYSYTQGEQIYFVSSSQSQNSNQMQVIDLITCNKDSAVRLVP